MNTLSLVKRITLLTFLLSSALAYAEGSSASEVESLLSQATAVTDTNARIERFSGAFLTKAYELGPLGEGPGAKYDQGPLYRFDAFDCTTYIETVLALTLSSDREAFERRLKKLRYQGGEVDFTSRNHFPDLDWMPNNIAAGMLEDMTARFASGLTVRELEAEVNKANWYKAMTPARIKLGLDAENKKPQLITSLRAEGAKFKPSKAKVAFVGFQDVFTKSGFSYTTNEKFFAAIPTGTFFNIVVRRAPKANVGTHLLIWHQGIFVRKPSGLFIRHASILSRRVVEVPAFEFLLYVYLSHMFDGGRESGINLFRVKNGAAVALGRRFTEKTNF